MCDNEKKNDEVIVTLEPRVVSEIFTLNSDKQDKNDRNTNKSDED